MFLFHTFPRYKIIACLIIICAVVLSYSNTLRNPFIWDDEGLIVNNPRIRNPVTAADIFLKNLYSDSLSGSNFYRPLQTLSFIMDYRLWRLNPAGYHITNILLQAAAGCLVFLLLMKITEMTAVSFAAALLFAVSPLHTETVAYISGRADILMAVCVLASLCAFLYGRDRAGAGRRAADAASLALFICALLSKELAVVYAVIPAVWTWCYRRSSRRRPLYAAAAASFPFAAVSAVYILLRMTVFNFSTQWPPELAQYPLMVRLSVFPQVILTYVKLVFLPINLHMSRTLMRPVTAGGIILSLCVTALIAAVSLSAAWRFRSHRNFTFFLIWAWLFFLPQSGVIPINAFAAEHFIYLPSISFYFALAYFLRKYSRRGIFALCVSGLAVSYGFLTVSRNSEWGDPFVFYRGILRYSPGSFLAHNNLGVNYERAGSYDEALMEFHKAAAIKPDRPEARANMAGVYVKLRRYDEALAEYAILERIAPAQKLGEIQNNIGIVYQHMREWRRALERFKRAFDLDPSLYFAWFNMAQVYRALGDSESASRAVMRSLYTDERSSPADSAGLRAAVHSYIRGIKEETSAVSFYNNLGVACALEGLIDASIVAFSRSLALSPSFADAWFNLGLAYLKKADKPRALDALNEALANDPAHARARGLMEQIRP